MNQAETHELKLRIAALEARVAQLEQKSPEFPAPHVANGDGTEPYVKYQNLQQRMRDTLSLKKA